MEPADLYLKHDKVFVLDDNNIVEVDYDAIKVDTVYYIITKTKNFSIYVKTETFDDDFIRMEKDKSKAEAYLRSNN